MDVKGAFLDLSLIRSASKLIDEFNFKDGFLKGIDGFNQNPLAKFESEFCDIIKSLSYLDNIIFKPKKFIDAHEFVVHFENDVAEMDCVTFITIDDIPYFVDIEVKNTTHIEQLEEQFQRRESNDLIQLNFNENYILLGFLNNCFKLGIIKDNRGRKQFDTIEELKEVFNNASNSIINIKTVLKDVEGILKIQEIKNKISQGKFNYYAATRDGIQSIEDNVKNNKKIIILYGNAGSGKTVVALSLFFKYKNVKMLVINKNLHSALSLYHHYKDGKCFYGTDQFINSLEENCVAVIDECQRLSIKDIVRIAEKAKSTILLGDENQAFAYGDSLFDENQLKNHLINYYHFEENDIVTKRLKKTARYNSKVNKLLESLHKPNSINNYFGNINDKVGEEFKINVTMSEDIFLSNYSSYKGTSKIYMIFGSHMPSRTKIYDKEFVVAGREDESFSIANYYSNYVGNTFHAISFDVDNSFVILKDIKLVKRSNQFYFCEKNVDDSLVTNEYLIKLSNQINILFTRGKKSLHILVDDFYVFLYINFLIKKGVK